MGLVRQVLLSRCGPDAVQAFLDGFLQP